MIPEGQQLLCEVVNFALPCLSFLFCRCLQTTQTTHNKKHNMFIILFATLLFLSAIALHLVQHERRRRPLLPFYMPRCTLQVEPLQPSNTILTLPFQIHAPQLRLPLDLSTISRYPLLCSRKINRLTSSLCFIKILH